MKSKQFVTRKDSLDRYIRQMRYKLFSECQMSSRLDADSLTCWRAYSDGSGVQAVDKLSIDPCLGRMLSELGKCVGGSYVEGEATLVD